MGQPASARGRPGGNVESTPLNGQGRRLNTPIRSLRRPGEARTKRPPNTRASRGGDKPGLHLKPLELKWPRKAVSCLGGLSSRGWSTLGLPYITPSPTLQGVVWPLLMRTEGSEGQSLAQGHTARERQFCLPHSQAATLARGLGSPEGLSGGGSQVRLPL